MAKSVEPKVEIKPVEIMQRQQDVNAAISALKDIM